MKPNQIRVVGVATIWCGLACYALTGLLIAMLLFNPPKQTDRWFGVMGFWLVATALIVGGNLVRIRALRQMKSGS